MYIYGTIMVDVIKILYCWSFCNKEIEFTIVDLQPVHRLPLVLHHVCLRPRNCYKFLVYIKLIAS